VGRRRLRGVDLRHLGLRQGRLPGGPRRALGAEAQRDADLAFDLGRELGIVGQELLGVVAALAEPRLAVGEERAGFLDQAVLHAEVEQAALA
jgi:hypothetical protein